MKYIALRNSRKVIMVDDEDYERLSKYNWRLDNKGYARCGSRLGGRSEPYITIRLHHEVIGKPTKGYVVDHINRNKLDNRKENLRFATHVQSEYNKDLQRNNTSGHRGVYFRKSTGRYIAQIGKGKTRQHLGCFNTLEEAVNAYEHSRSQRTAIR